MARERTHLFALNGGAVSPKALGRTDLARMRITAEIFKNCFPSVLGPLQFRPGLGFQDSTKNDAVSRNLPFIFSAEDTALIELTNLLARPIVDGTVITRNAVSTVVPSGAFSASTGWTLSNANINTTVSGALVLDNSARGTVASAKASASVISADRTVEHGIKVVVTKGRPKFKIGSTSGGDDVLEETELLPGTHSLAFTPGSGVATIYFEFNSDRLQQEVIDSCEIEGAITVEMATQWPASELFGLRYEQSGDVVFVVHPGYKPRRFERRGPRSWSLTDYQFRNGPWRGKTANVKLSASARVGNGTLTSDAPFFRAEHVGCLFELSHTETNASLSLAGDDTFTDWIRVSGPDQQDTRSISYSVAGTYTGTLTLQVADDPDGPWQRYKSNPGNNTYKIGDANQINYVRAGFIGNAHTSGTASVTLTSEGGGGTGVVRITGYANSQSVSYEVVERLHSTDATSDWREGKYSGVNGYPSAVSLFDGRLWFGGRDQIAGSGSDDFDTFYDDDPTDASPIVRSIATGPVNRVQWLLSLSRLIVGTSGAEVVAKSSSFDEPMTPTNFSVKDASTIGSANVQAVKIDKSGMFVSKNAKKAYQMSYNVEVNDYATSDATRYNPSILSAGVKVVAVQRQPDTRVWFVLQNGTAAVLTWEPAEDVIAWSTFETDGEIEDVCVLPDTEGDDVYLIVKRTINGVEKRYREVLAHDLNAEGGSLNRMADSYKVVTIASTTTVTGLSHLEAKQVVVWAGDEPLLDGDGNPATFIVSGGQITLPAAFTGDVVVGIPYEGQFKSTKLAYASVSGTAVTQRKNITLVAPLLYKTHIRGPLWADRFGEIMDPIPLNYRGEDIDINTLLDDYDADGYSLPGGWSTDSRLCAKFRAPLPTTVLGVVLGIESHERG